MERQPGEIDVLAGDLDGVDLLLVRICTSISAAGCPVAGSIQALVLAGAERDGEAPRAAGGARHHLEALGAGLPEQLRLVGRLDDRARSSAGRQRVVVNLDLAEIDQLLDEAAQAESVRNSRLRRRCRGPSCTPRGGGQLAPCLVSFHHIVSRRPGARALMLKRIGCFRLRPGWRARMMTATPMRSPPAGGMPAIGLATAGNAGLESTELISRSSSRCWPAAVSRWRASSPTRSRARPARPS